MNLVLKPIEYRIVCGLAALSLILTGIDIGLYYRNQALQTQVEIRAQYIQQTNQFLNLYQETARTLANFAIERQDGTVKAMLEGEGLSFNSESATTKGIK